MYLGKKYIIAGVGKNRAMWRTCGVDEDNSDRKQVAVVVVRSSSSSSSSTYSQKLLILKEENASTSRVRNIQNISGDVSRLV